MEHRQHHYDAFISYRHAELDSAVAVALHKKLERFRLPSNLHKDYPKDRWKINRVFRDQDELPLADNLSDPIEEAIRNSDFLLVICTPRLPESQWCAREIELFKQCHGQDHILAVLAEGEPEQSFPEGICFRDVETTDEDGNKTVIRQPVEPLAADVRADNARKRNKMLDDAVLRVAAPMYGLGYDDLKQRHREQRIRKIAAISGIAAGVFFVFGLVCMMLSMKISAQKKLIEEQNIRLQEQYVEEQRKYAESMSVVSDTLFKEGRQKDAAYAVWKVMPETNDDYDLAAGTGTGDALPYVSSAQYALSSALGDYEMNVFFPCDVLPLPGEEEQEEFWGDPGEYRYMEEYLGNQWILCAEPLEDGTVLMVTSACKLFVYDPDAGTFRDYTNTWFSDPPDKYAAAAAYRDKMLYLWFSDADYVAAYRWLDTKGEKAGTITADELKSERGALLKDGEEAVSDDGKYRIRQEANHTVMIFEKDASQPVRTLYDLKGSFVGLKAGPWEGVYILEGGGKYSYLLDQSFEMIARIPYFYKALPEEKELLLYAYIEDGKDYDLYRVHAVDYKDLMDEAEQYLKGYSPSEEISERYKMLK